ncbi:MAG: phosphoribosylglycinamide formyltransferase [Clostridia bacterium]|nr:phosphoribosylglycinamide formyltransferase [Clostridia bacterium]
MTRIAVLVSGSGTNLQRLLEAEADGGLSHGKIELVISDHAEAYALVRAADHGVPTAVVERRGCADRQQFEAKITALLSDYRVDLIVLAGFLTILSGDFTSRWPQRIINVHPSLIPAFCGKGFYGLKVHEAVLAAGVTATGATVHFVNEIPDGGPIILQQEVAVEAGDTPEILQRRVMEQAEWVLLPRAVDLVAAQIQQETEKKHD